MAIPASPRRATLVHSVAMDRQFWQPVAERLAKDAAVVTFDCRGHGASDKPTGPYTVEQFADDIADMLDHLGWDKTLIAGASMGGMVALAFAGRHPSRTSALGLIDTTAWYGPEAAKNWAGRANQAVEKGLASLLDFQTTRWFGDEFRAKRTDVVQQCIDIFLKNDVPAYVEACHMLGRADLRAALPMLDDADGGGGRRGRLRRARRDGAGAARRHRRLDHDRAAEGAAPDAAGGARHHRGRARPADGARTMKFTGELSVKAPRHGRLREGPRRAVLCIVR